MKNQLRNSVAILLAITTILFNGCKKGKDGAPGKDGSTNVTAYTFSVSAWSYNSPEWYRAFTVPELTLDNIHSASVQVYLLTATNTWTALPNTFYNSGAADYLMGFNTTIGSVKVTWIYDSSSSTGDNPNTFFGTSSSQFKVVVIPPAAIAANPYLDLNNYNKVKTTFKLAD